MSHSSPGRESSYWLERSKGGITPSLLVCGRKARERLNQNLIRNRFPHRSEILSVFAIAVFVCFSWTLIHFFHEFSSYILYFRVAEVAAILAYMMAVALLESLALTGLLVLLGALLPSNWLKNGFAYKGFVIIAIAAIASILFQRALENQYPSTLFLIVSAGVPIILAAIVIGVLQSTPKLQHILLNIQDRFLILLFIYVPIGIISLIAVAFRILI